MWEAGVCARQRRCWTALFQPLLQVFTLLPLLHRWDPERRLFWEQSLQVNVPSCEVRGRMSRFPLGAVGISTSQLKALWCCCLRGRLLHCTFLWGLLWGLSASSSSSLTSASENKLRLHVFGTFLREYLIGTAGAERWLCFSSWTPQSCGSRTHRPSNASRRLSAGRGAATVADNQACSCHLQQTLYIKLKVQQGCSAYACCIKHEQEKYKESKKSYTIHRPICYQQTDQETDRSSSSALRQLPATTVWPINLKWPPVAKTKQALSPFQPNTNNLKRFPPSQSLQCLISLIAFLLSNRMCDSKTR